MNQCPVCSTEIPDSFGLVECPNCHKILVANLDGSFSVQESASSQSQIMESDRPTNEKAELSSLTNNSKENNFGDQFFNEVLEEGVLSDSVQDNEKGGLENSIEPLQAQLLADSEPRESFGDDLKGESVDSEREEEGLLEDFGADQEDVLTKMLDPKEVINKINDFGNAKDPLLRQGEFLYNVRISDIDTEELKEQVLDILRDSRLSIDGQKLHIKSGELILQDLNAIKASVVVSRIKELPLSIDWEQILNRDREVTP